jgi:hypothetical protein
VPRFVAGEVLGVIEMYFSALLLADALMPRDTVSAITRFSVFMEIILSPYIVCANIMFLSNSACKGFLHPAHFCGGGAGMDAHRAKASLGALQRTTQGRKVIVSLQGAKYDAGS